MRAATSRFLRQAKIECRDTASGCLDRGAMIGHTIAHYTIVDKIGTGGMGVLDKARYVNRDRIVALKFLPEHRYPR